MKKTSTKKLHLKKDIVARLSKEDMNTLGGAATTQCIKETDLCATGKVKCPIYTIYSHQSCTQYCN